MDQTKGQIKRSYKLHYDQRSEPYTLNQTLEPYSSSTSSFSTSIRTLRTSLISSRKQALLRDKYPKKCVRGKDFIHSVEGYVGMEEFDIRELESERGWGRDKRGKVPHTDKMKVLMMEMVARRVLEIPSSISSSNSSNSLSALVLGLWDLDIGMSLHLWNNFNQTSHNASSSSTPSQITQHTRCPPPSSSSPSPTSSPRSSPPAPKPTLRSAPSSGMPR